MTTYSDLIENTRQHLMTGQPDRLNVLDSDITSAAPTLTLRYTAKGVGEGGRLVIGIEEMHILAVTTTGESTTVTVIRGFNNSAQVAHSEGDIVYVNPQFSSWRIARTINTALDDISGDGLFRILNTTVASSTTVRGYDLSGLTKFIDVWKVRYDTVGPAQDWPSLRRDEYWIDSAPNATDFAGGKALFIRQGIPSNQNIELSYKAGFNYLSALTDDVLTTSGLHSEAHDLPCLRAAIMLLSGREIKRSFLNRQPEPRRQEEVPPGAANQSMRPLIELYKDRLHVEIKRLKRIYPGSI